MIVKIFISFIHVRAFDYFYIFHLSLHTHSHTYACMYTYTVTPLSLPFLPSLPPSLILSLISNYNGTAELCTHSSNVQVSSRNSVVYLKLRLNFGKALFYYIFFIPLTTTYTCKWSECLEYWEWMLVFTFFRLNIL